jgi:hypothetical protein
MPFLNSTSYLFSIVNKIFSYPYLSSLFYSLSASWDMGVWLSFLTVLVLNFKAVAYMDLSFVWGVDSLLLG